MCVCQMYFGSVRFFKHVIFLTALLLIAVPLLLVTKLTAGNNRYADEIEELNLALFELQRQPLTVIEDYPIEPLVDFKDDKALEIIPAKPFDGFSYQALYPDMFFDDSWNAMNVQANSAYLTFDDGPSERTAEILDILKRLDVKATFFVVGQTNQRAAELMLRIVEEGHTIGAHTFSHSYAKIYNSVESYLDDFYQIFNLIRENTGEAPRLFRFPGGSINVYNAGLYREIIAEMLRRGFIFYDWNVSSADASIPKINKEQILRNVMEGSNGKIRSIILLHDSSSHNDTVAALPNMIGELQKMGFRLNRLTEQEKPVAFAYHLE